MMTRAFGGTVAACLLAGTMLPGPGGAAQRRDDGAAAATPDPVKAGADAWAGGAYARAIAIWRPLAAAGDADAQYDLAQAYRLGRGVTRDEKIAQDWFRKAAQQGHPQAQANYGLLLFQGGDRKDALPWLRKAADRGDARAQYVVGTALFNGDIAAKDWVRAYALMTRAAASGLPPAVTSLAEMDRFVPLAQRAQGTALARDLQRSATLAMADEANADLVRGTPAAVSAPPASARSAAVAVSPPPPAARRAASVPVPGAERATPAARPVTGQAAAALSSIPAARRIMPVPARAIATPIPPVAGSGWRVQVGAFGDPGAAGRAWSAIAARTPGLILRSYLVRAGAVTRLQAGPLASRADASKACARIKAANGGDCFPVAAN